MNKLLVICLFFINKLSCENTLACTLPPPECDPNFECNGGTIVIDDNDCPICVYDTCIDVGCPIGEFCVVHVQIKADLQTETATCVPNPCMIDTPLVDQIGVTISCSRDNGNLEKLCPFDYTCTPVPIVDDSSGVCCKSPTTSDTPSSVNPSFY